MKSLSEVSYRKATENDVSELIELRIKQLVDEGYPEIKDIRNELRRYFTDSLSNGLLICWLGICDGSVIATSGLCFYQLPCSFSNPTGMNAYITNMYTSNEFRQQGIATHLIDKLLMEAEALGYPGVKLHASEDGEGVYERAGFVRAPGYMGLKF